MNIAQNICDAIDIIVNRAIEQATFAKTIVAQVLECVDAAAGLYKVKYQESIYQATCDNLELQYKKGTDVYVLIPEGDFSKAKKILGAVSVLGADYREQAERDAEFDYIGGDLIVDNHEVDLHSYRMEMIDIPINVDIEAATESFTQSEYFIFGAEFKTAIPRENQYYGNYGLILTLEFEDDITREYVLDVDHMVGQPYNQTKYTRQIAAFPIEGAQFKGVKSVIAFSQKFPNKDTSKPADIFIRNIELCGANKNGYVQENGTLNILTPQGILIKDVESLLLQAEVRIRGKVLDPANHNLSFYWFKENAGIDAEQEKYNQYGGQGWECLNDYIPLGEGKVDWLSGTNIYQVKREDCLTRETKYKCVGIYNDNIVLENTVIIKNYDAVELTIESSKGTQFYYNQGHTTLTCLVDNQENLDYTYKWVMVNSFCNYKELLETLEDNDRYAETVDALEYVKGQLANFKIFKEHECILEDFAALNAYFKAKFELENQEETFTYDDFCNYAESYIKNSSLNRIEKNKITNIPAKSIVDFVEYKCAVYDTDENLIGTASIRLTNSFDDKGVYGLVIHGGDQVFKYDESGRSPAHHTMENPMDILPLTFSIYDENGDRIEEDLTEVTSYIEWRIPLFNTMLKPDSSSIGSDEIDYLLIESSDSNDALSLPFDIVSNFNRNASKNQILLEVGFRGKALTAQTNFGFFKEGDSGTNGTNYVCRIVPNTIDNVATPMLIWDGAEAEPKLNYTPESADKWFKVQLWDIAQNVEITEGLKVKWSILANKYRSNIVDDTLIKITEDGSCSVIKPMYGNVDNIANIIRVEVDYDNKKYFATLPLVLAVFQTPGAYRAEIRGGFNSVVYSSDGRHPQYNTLHPFEVYCEHYDNGIWTDISTASTHIKYEWLAKGKLWTDVLQEDGSIKKEWIDYNGLTPISFADARYNEQKFKPIDPYDGQCVTNAIRVNLKDVKNNDTWIGTLYYPIYFGLNRFGIAAINDWDGNSITLDEEGGMVISPQVGAGKKDDNNRFTGVVIGTVDDKSDSKKETGLVGYSAGQRSIFLDAETGKAEFGVQGKGRIILDPTKDTAVIQSGNYSESEKTGMMIDFTTPEIKYGSGKFKVDANGVLNATDGIFSGTIYASGGSIGNWQIKNNRLQTENGSVYLGTDGFKVGDKFNVDSDGTLHASGASIDGHGTFSGNIYAEDGEFKGIIYARDGEFTGVIHARDGEFSGTITATGGSIGGIQIGRNDGLKGVGWSISPSGITCTNITMGGKTFIPSTIYDNNVWWYPDGIPDSSSVTCITSLNPLYDSTGQYVTGFSPSKVTFKYNGSQTKYTCIATTS